MNLERYSGKGVLQPSLDQRNREMRDVDADPCPPQFLRRMNRRPTPAKRIEHEIAFIRRYLNDAFKERKRLLGRIAEAFSSGISHSIDIGPHRPNLLPFFFVEIHLQAVQAGRSILLQ